MYSVLQSRKLREHLVRIISYIFLTLLCIIAVFPFYWLLSNIIRVPEDMFKTPPVLIPKTFSLYNFAKVIGLTSFGDIGFLSYLKNSLIISILTTILATCSAGLAAYSLCHFRGRGERSYPD